MSSISLASPGSLESRLDRLHAAARAQPGLHRLAIISRILLALAFIPTGLVKALGHRFTSMPIETEIGFFFEAMYRSGVYWNFIGLAQISTGLLLLVPRTAPLGAVLFFPIILNIHVITTSIGFIGTPILTGLMLLASTFLICWEYSRWKALVWPAAQRDASPVTDLDGLERAGYVLGTLAGLGALLWSRDLVPAAILHASLLVGALALLLVLAGWTRFALRQKPPSPS